MGKNQGVNPSNWRNFLKKYLEDADNAFLDRVGVDPAAVTLPLLRAALNSPGTVVAVLPELTMVDRVAAEIEAILREVGLELSTLVIPEAGRGKLLFPGGESKRARALNLALDASFRLVLGSVHALLAPAPPPEETREAILTLRPGMEISVTELVERLVRLDYDDEYEATVAGEFARRGGIVDIFSPAADAPCRVEFFGDAIDSLRGFSPETQRSTGEIAEYRVIGRAGITAGGAAAGDLFNYFEKRDWRMLVVYPELCRERLARYSEAERVERFDHLLEKQQKAGLSLSLLDAVAEAYVFHAPSADAFPATGELAGELAPEARQGAEELRRELFIGAIRGAAARAAVALVAPHEENLPAFREYCNRHRLGDLAIEFDVAGLQSGFSLPGIGLLVVTEKELLHTGFLRDTAVSDGELQAAEMIPARIPEFSLAELDEGDYAVHLDHGIGIYRGFKRMENRGISREVLVLEYRDGQLMYVPLLQAHKVSRYLGSAGKVTLHKLGGARWSRDKESVRQSVRSYAADMLRLQAMRQAAPGIAFPKDDAEGLAFLKAFPYADTPDQRRSTAEMKRDMESTRPMDRLLCGDVGYGKTEIAMRAVFKAVAAGYQAAILAPTTVLAQQHYYSFRERFAAYPFNIEVLSRFRSAGEQEEVIRRLERGAVDIVIGTHRLCNPELKFSNLGLVVIDEEQRFGVKHKERLRHFRAEVDVLTMSATPIPRTLYLAMAGARDLSTLMTAPKQRLPVKTVIAPAEEPLIVQAIRAELARGGQIYYLHNRVRSIEDTADHLRKLIPEARFAIAHGQMPEHELEEVMNAFLEGRVDCLVCSTIVESGLDVPNANTIIIERADRFGLAELYQLRGRVGRWKHQAYAYLLLPPSQLVSSDARKRLAAIRRCSNLGAGFQLALHDLEIRGSGNLLGSEQSGHLNLIGFDLYCQLLQQEVGHLRGEKREFLPEVELGIEFVSFTLTAPKDQLAAAFPAAYIGAERLRLDAYRKLAALESEEALEEFAVELRDRFGPLPECAKNLLEVVRLRILAARAGYELFNVAENRVTLRNPGGTVYRIKGLIPTLDPRDPPKLRLAHLLKILRGIPERREEA